MKKIFALITSFLFFSAVLPQVQAQSTVVITNFSVTQSTNSSAIAVWETNVAVEGGIELTAAGQTFEFLEDDPVPDKLHTTFINSLQVGATYSVRAIAITDDLEYIYSNAVSFTMVNLENPAPTPAPAPQPIPTPNCTPSHPTGTLGEEAGTIYFLMKKSATKIPFTNFAAFQGLGYKTSNVKKLSLSCYKKATTYWLESPTQAHPWGSWVIWQGKTIYYVGEEGLIGVPTWEIFLNNGGATHLILPLNAADDAVWSVKKNSLPVLQMNDSRVL